MTAVSQITGKISEYNAQKLGTEYFEVEWHAGARPTHAVWQGRVWSKQQLYSVCGLGTVTGLLGVNCYHTYYPFFPGLSERNWSDGWLDAKNLEESEPKKFGDREYTLYEAKQKQRQMELAMRAQREKVRLLQKGKADPDEILLNKAKYQGQLNEYSRFCRKMKLTEERERIYLDMKGRVATNSKRQNALFPREMIENAFKDVAQYKRYKEVLGDYIGSLVNFGQMKYNDSEKWKIISEAYIDVKWQSQALKKKQIGEVHEKAFEQMQEEEKALQKTGKNSEITKGYCEMFNHLLDNILGEGVSEKLFGGKYNTLTTDRVYGEFLEICSTQVKSNNAERTKIVSKYRPNRAQRRAKK